MYGRIIGYVATASCTAVLALGSAVIAVAEPVWDIGEYDQCMTDGEGNPRTEEFAYHCCKYSGGVWDWNGEKCQTPPPEAQGTRAPEAGTAPGQILDPPQSRTAPTPVTVLPGDSSGTRG